jgi:hypothetical protein
MNRKVSLQYMNIVKATKASCMRNRMAVRTLNLLIISNKVLVCSMEVKVSLDPGAASG